MKQQRTVAAAVSIALVLSGCATASKDIASSYTSPNQYASYDCAQLAAEAGRIQTRIVQTGGRLDQAAQNDAGIMAVGLILFWPVLFALGGTKQQEAEYGRLKGEYDAIEQASIAKKCAHVVPTSAPNAQLVAAPAAGTVQSVSIKEPPSAAATVYAPPQSTASQTMVATSVAAPLTSKYMVSAERFVKDSGCVGAVATLNIRSTSYETFTVTCATGDPRSVRCDDGVCRELK